VDSNAIFEILQVGPILGLMMCLTTLYPLGMLVKVNPSWCLPPHIQQVMVDMAIGIFFYFPSIDCHDVMYISVTMKKFRYLLCLDFPISLIFCVWRCHGDHSCLKI
jgi:hypothetical protein